MFVALLLFQLSHSAGTVFDVCGRTTSWDHTECAFEEIMLCYSMGVL